MMLKKIHLLRQILILSKDLKVIVRQAVEINLIGDEKGKVLEETKDMVKRWKKYMRKLM